MIFCRDHLCNLYGPTVISEDVKNNIVIRHVPENEEEVDNQNEALELEMVAVSYPPNLFTELSFLISKKSSVHT